MNCFLMIVRSLDSVSRCESRPTGTRLGRRDVNLDLQDQRQTKCQRVLADAGYVITVWLIYQRFFDITIRRRET